MDISRRSFLYRTGTFAAFGWLLPSLALTSCNSTGRAGHVRMGFIGPETHFRYHGPVFQKLKNTSVERVSFDDALDGDFHVIFIESNPGIKATHIILLLEESKDIITPHPLASSLSEYNRIQEFLVRHDRRLGMLNPLYFYPAVNTLKDELKEKEHEISEISISCHPTQLVKGYTLHGATGTVALLQRMISHITGKFPISLFFEKTTKSIRRWIIDYGAFQASVQVDPGQTGWILDVDGPQMHALADHTGLLTMNDEVGPRHSPDPYVWTQSMIKNFEDNLQSVRLRGEPQVNSLDGLSALILQQAAEKALHNGVKANL